MKNKFMTVALLATISCSAQNIPVAVQNAFAKSFPKITVKKWDKEDGNYEANFIKDGKMMSAIYDGTGKWMETETDIAVTDLPEAAINYIHTKFKGSVIEDASVLSRPNILKLYEAGIKGKDLLFDEQGKFLKEETEEDTTKEEKD